MLQHWLQSSTKILVRVLQAHSKEATKKATVDALWQQLNRRPSSSNALQPEGEGKPQPPKPASTLSLAALCRPVKKSAGASDKVLAFFL